MEKPRVLYVPEALYTVSNDFVWATPCNEPLMSNISIVKYSSSTMLSNVRVLHQVSKDLMNVHQLIRFYQLSPWATALNSALRWVLKDLSTCKKFPT